MRGRDMNTVNIIKGGAIVTEGIFNLPGLGHEIVRAYNFNDLPVITGIVVFSTICVIVFNFIVDRHQSSFWFASVRRRCRQRCRQASVLRIGG